MVRNYYINRAKIINLPSIGKHQPKDQETQYNQAKKITGTTKRSN